MQVLGYFPYFYLWLVLSDLGCILLAAFRRDMERLCVLIPTLFFFLIGLSCEFQYCNLWMCAGPAGN